MPDVETACAVHTNKDENAQTRVCHQIYVGYVWAGWEIDMIYKATVYFKQQSAVSHQMILKRKWNKSIGTQSSSTCSN